MQPFNHHELSIKQKENHHPFFSFYLFLKLFYFPRQCLRDIRTFLIRLVLLRSCTDKLFEVHLRPNGCCSGSRTTQGLYSCLPSLNCPFLYSTARCYKTSVITIPNQHVIPPPHTHTQSQRKFFSVWKRYNNRNYATALYHWHCILCKASTNIKQATRRY